MVLNWSWVPFVCWLYLKFHLMASASSQSARRGSCQSLRDATSQSSKVGRRKWTIFEVEKLVEAMREMVEAGVYKADNGFKPGYLHFLEEKMRASYPSSGFKAKPHIESCVKTLKKNWTTVHDILTGVRRGRSGVGYDNGTNTIVASDDIWVDCIKESGAANVSTIMTSVAISSGMVGRLEKMRVLMLIILTLQMKMLLI